MFSHPLGRVAVALAAVALAGCNETAPPSAVVRPAAAPTTAPTTAPAGPAVAHISGITVTRADLDGVLYRAYGIDLLTRLVEVDLAKQALAQKGLTVTPADVADERRRAMEGLFGADKDHPENFDSDFAQLKSREHLTDTQFDLLMQSRAMLRKLAHPQVAGQVPESSVRQAFGILYGENRVISDITVQNAVEAAEVHRRLAAGEAWPMVVREMSIDVRTRDVHPPQGQPGQWPPFSAKTPGVPDAIMKEAFALTVGQVSAEPIVEGQRYHLIKLLDVIPPKVVKYDDVKADVRRQVEDQLEEQFITALREQIKRATVANLQLDDPALQQSWDAMIAAQLPKGQTLSAGEADKKIHQAEGPPAATRPKN